MSKNNRETSNNIPTISDQTEHIINDLHEASKGRDGVFYVSRIAIQHALAQAKNGATQKAADLLEIAGSLPYSQVKPDHLLHIARRAAFNGRLNDAQEAAKKGIQMARHTIDERYLDIETVVYSRTHQALTDIQMLGMVFLDYLQNKNLTGQTASKQDEEAYLQELMDQISILENESIHGPFKPVPDLPGKGYSELHVTSQFVLSILERIGNGSFAQRVKETIYARMPDSIKKIGIK